MAEKKYIELQRALDVCETHYQHCLEMHDWNGDTTADNIMRDIETIPTADVVSVVRCKDCENWDKDTKIKAPYCNEEGKPIDMTMVDYAECEQWSCWSTAKYTRYNDFCSCAKALKEREKK